MHMTDKRLISLIHIEKVIERPQMNRCEQEVLKNESQYESILKLTYN